MLTDKEFDIICPEPLTFPRIYSIMMEGYLQFGGLRLSQSFARNLG